MLVTEDKFDLVIELIENAKEIGIDTETSGIRVSDKIDYLTGICIATDEIKAYFPFRHQEGNLERHHLAKLINTIRPKTLFWHNRKFDMHSLRTIGVDPLKLTGTQYCSMLLAHLWNENHFSFELDHLAKKYLDVGKTIDMNEIAKIHGGWANIPATVMAPYGVNDAKITLDLGRFMLNMVKREDLHDVYINTEMPFTSLLYKLEQQGVGVNLPFVERKAHIGRKRMATLEREIGFNPASPKQIGKYLIEDMGLPVFAHTASCQECKRKKPLSSHEGPPSFNKKAMEDYDDILQASNNPTAKRISEYRGWQKAVTSLYEPLLTLTAPDGRIRTNFKQHGTVTGRLSANSPNLQQVPRASSNVWNGDAKSSFTSGREGYVLYGWDYSQLELRIAATYGQEKLLLDEFKKPDADPFSVLAPLIFGVLTPETRHQTKTFVYANLYGAGPAKIALQLGRTLEETQDLYKRYQRSISGIMAVNRQVTQLIEQRKYVKYWDGRKRHFKSKSEAYKGWNSLCQGGGAQLVKQSMLRCQEFEDENCIMVLQVHDEITFIIKEGMIEHYEPMIVKAMTDWPEFTAVMAVDGKEWK